MMSRMYGGLSLLTASVVAGAQERSIAVRWSALDSLFAAEAAAGFSGVVLVRRDSEVVLRKAYGLRDRTARTPMTLDAVLDIGSLPMNFTLTLVEQLRRAGRLSLDDSLGRYLPGVPEDKRGITLRHLTSGRSGVADFVHNDADWDPDLSWIAREEFERRMLAAPLRFAPGGGPEHSHGALGLLAAVVERASGTSFARLVYRRIIEPLGLLGTGFYGETRGLPLERFAVGEGASAGLPNIPPNWGPTSWLIMGSGGMFSTLDDLQRYFDATATPAYATREGGSGRALTLGGTDRGFLTMYLSDGPGSSVLVLENSNVRPEVGRQRLQVFRELLGM